MQCSAHLDDIAPLCTYAYAGDSYPRVVLATCLCFLPPEPGRIGFGGGVGAKVIMPVMLAVIYPKTREAQVSLLLRLDIH